MVLDEAFKLSARDEVLQRPDIRKTGIHPNFWYPIARSDNVKTGRSWGRDLCFPEMRARKFLRNKMPVNFRSHPPTR